MGLENFLADVAKIIAHPHTTVTEHDIERAEQVFLALSSYDPALPHGDFIREKHGF